jgi:hypothetical protein
MSTDPLESLVHNWATESDVEEIKETWMAELRGQGIGNIQALLEIAEYTDTWQQTLEHFSGLLRAKLRKWYDTAAGIDEIRMKRQAHDEVKSHHVSFAPLKELKRDDVDFVSWPTRSDFEEMMLSNLPYIDKTRHILELTKVGHAFLGLAVLERLSY